MTPEDADILHVSDTALMVAACRAMETARPDGLVRDPFAEQLAGARGMAIARSLPRMEIMCFGVGMRSRFLDELVLGAVAERQVATVLSLGSGLDTRPWRLDVPPHLRWIEVDFPAMLDYKSAILAQHPPKCRMERRPADLNDPSQRSAVLAAVDSSPALMITEGLLMYLPSGTVEALAAESVAAIRYWLLDLTSPQMAHMLRMDSYQGIQKVRAADNLDGARILEALNRNGWTSLLRRSYITDTWAVAGERIRAMTGGRAQAPPAATDDPSGVHLFGKV